jgi:hypothetical protein
VNKRVLLRFGKENRIKFMSAVNILYVIILLYLICFTHFDGLTLSDPMSDLVRHYDFPVPDAFLDL